MFQAAQRQGGVCLGRRSVQVSLLADRHKHNFTVEQVFNTEAHPLPVQGSPAAEQAVRRQYSSPAETIHRLSGY